MLVVAIIAAAAFIDKFYVANIQPTNVDPFPVWLRSRDLAGFTFLNERISSPILDPVMLAITQVGSKNRENLWEDWLANVPDRESPGYRETINFRLGLMLDSDLYRQFIGIAFLAALEASDRRSPLVIEEYFEYLHDDIVLSGRRAEKQTWTGRS